MKVLCRVTAFSLAIFFIVSCGTIKKTVPPRYHFDIGKTLQYQIKGNADVSIDAGIIKTSGKMDYSALLEITAIETNAAGYKLHIDIRDPQITTPIPQISTAFYMAVNSLQNAVATVQLTEQGQTSLSLASQPLSGISAYASLAFPDFSDYQGLIRGTETNLKIPVDYQNQPLMLEFKKHTKLQNSTPSSVLITNVVLLKAFDRRELEKSVEASPMGSFKLDMFDIFQIKPGRLWEKKGTFQFSFEMPLKSGFLTITMALIGNGGFDVILTSGEK